MSWEPGCHCPAFHTYVQVVPHQSWLHFIDLPSTPQYVCDTQCLYLKLVHTNRETGITYKYRNGHPIDSGMAGYQQTWPWAPDKTGMDCTMARYVVVENAGS